MIYRRADIKGGAYFLTINLADRHFTLLTDEFDKLRNSINKVKQRHHFVLDAMVVPPDHLHLLITLPEGDSDFSTPKTENIKKSRIAKQERGIWQRRFWEHFIRDETDFERHVDYIHYNPVKHGYVEQAAQWEFSTIHKYIEKGVISSDWGSNQNDKLDSVFGER
ncbi:UNVERIFIED_CONTAM: hypothetical protein GTU68_017045 [Idotea baltica]|nr:hypothetical protein [Idotea baltica]